MGILPGLRLLGEQSTGPKQNCWYQKPLGFQQNGPIFFPTSRVVRWRQESSKTKSKDDTKSKKETKIEKNVMCLAGRFR